VFFFLFLGGKFSSLGYKKQFTATHTNYLCGKNVPKLSDFNDKISEIAIVRQYRIPAGCQNIAGFLKLSTFLSDL
jgi:hypothetical protein